MKTKLKLASKAQMKQAAKKVVSSLAKKGLTPIAAHHPAMKAQMLKNANMHPPQKSPAVPEVTPPMTPDQNYQG